MEPSIRSIGPEMSLSSELVVGATGGRFWIASADVASVTEGVGRSSIDIDYLRIQPDN